MFSLQRSTDALFHSLKPGAVMFRPYVGWERIWYASPSFCPKGAQYVSPGQRPVEQMASLLLLFLLRIGLVSLLLRLGRIRLRLALGEMPYGHDSEHNADYPDHNHCPRAARKPA